jgi:phage terminase small subunit
MAGVKGKSGGHNRKSSREKQLLGQNRKERVSRRAPDAIPGPMMEFDGLGENGTKLRAFFLPMLQNNQTIGITDSLALHRFCQVAEEWFKAAEMCKTRGRMMPVKDKDGKVVSMKVAPWHKIERDLARGLAESIRDLGLSPLARDSVSKICEGKEVNPFGKIT